MLKGVFLATEPPGKSQGGVSLLADDVVAGRGLKLDSCLTLRNELSEKTHVLTKQEILLGKGTRLESSRVREPRRTALPRGSQSFYGDGISFRVVLSQSF